MIDNDKTNYEAFLEGDIRGFESLVKRYKNNLIFFIMSYVNDVHIAEDVAQDSFVEVYVHKERFNVEFNFKTYLFTIARNKSIDYIRANRKHMNHEDISELEISDDMLELEALIIKEEKNHKLYDAIKSLKPEAQQIIKLMYFEEMSVKETAVILGKTQSMVKVNLHRARKKLREVLERE